jgi:hypothetical protein
MTDEEVICEFMEPDAPKDGRTPPRNEFQLNKFSPKGWWRYSMVSCLWKQPILIKCSPRERLGYLWEVEERLLELRKMRWVQVELVEMDLTWIWHASAAHRIRAVAAVIRSIVGAQAADTTVGALPQT